jgi:protein TonB
MHVALCLAGSMALHAGLIGQAFHVPRPTPAAFSEPPSITVALVEEPRLANVPAPQRPEPPPHEPPPSAPAPVESAIALPPVAAPQMPPPRSAVAKPAAPAVPRPGPPQPTRAPARAPNTLPATIATSPSSVPATVQATPPAGPPPAPPSTAWRDAIADWIDRNRIYPAEARRHGEEGVVLLRFVLDGSGSVLSASIRQGSGFDRLDQATLDMMSHAKLPPSPEGKAEASFTVAVRYRLTR